MQYRQRFSAAAAYRDALWRVLCNNFFQRLVDPGGVLLDLGCGWGEFSNNILARKKYAMDMNPDAASYLDSDVTLLLQDCSTTWPLEENSLDVVFTSNFLEHLPSKQHVEAAVFEASRCLKPGGRLIALGPNIRLLPGSYWDFWDHHVPISDHSLAELLKLNHFKVLKQHPAFLPYTMSDGKQPSLLLVRLYLRLPIVWKLFGRQFLLVAERDH